MGMAIKVLRLFGWLTATAGMLVFLLCVVLLLNRSPGDFEGTMTGAAIGAIVLFALPAFVVGLVIVAFAQRRRQP